jgi:hypothetical protein
MDSPLCLHGGRGILRKEFLNYTRRIYLMELKFMKIWSIFKYKPDGTKMPCWPGNGKWGLKWRNPDNLVTYDEAIRSGQMFNAAGLGIVIPPDYFAIDLDDVVSPDGVIDERASKLVDAIDSYTERSPSGTGFHILVKAGIDSAKNITIEDDSGLTIEVKVPGTYLTFTGDVFHDTEIRDRTEIIQATYDKYSEDHPAKESASAINPPSPCRRIVDPHKCTYGETALKSECELIRATPRGRRTHTLYGGSAAMGELIPEGHISEAEATRELIAAGVASGLDRAKVEDQVDKGLQRGMRNPRHIECRQALRIDISGISRR